MQPRSGQPGGGGTPSGAGGAPNSGAMNAQRTSQSSTSPTSDRKQQERGRLLKERFQWLSQFNDEELEQISLCDAGAPMIPGDDYFDISHPERGPFTGRAGELVPEGACLLRKGAMSPGVWSKLSNFSGRQSGG